MDYLCATSRSWNNSGTNRLTSYGVLQIWKSVDIFLYLYQISHITIILSNSRNINCHFGELIPERVSTDLSNNVN